MPDVHYTHPRLAEIYDLDSPWAADKDFYLSLAGPPCRKVLDLGCGTGILCDGLARIGHVVTGVDPAAAMLDVAKRKPQANKIEWVQSSAQNYRSDKRFHLIVMTGHAFQVLLTNEDVLATFTTMRKHLEPDGVIAFESRNPAIDWDKEWARSSVWKLPIGDVHQSRSGLTTTGQRISFDHRYRFPDETLISVSTLRFMSQREIEKLLVQVGFQVIEVFGDWSARPFDVASSFEMIFTAHTGAQEDCGA